MYSFLINFLTTFKYTFFDKLRNMVGLITVNKLIEMLLEEVRTFDFEKYHRLFLRKARITQEIRDKRETFALLEELSNELLPEQIRIVSYYVERLPRLERIIDILRRAKLRISKEQEEEYEQLIELLKMLIKIARKKLLSVLEAQEIALKRGKQKKYLKLVNKEHKIGYEFVKPLSRLGVRFDTNTFRTKRSINWKLVILFKATVILIGLAGMGLTLHPESPLASTTRFVPLKECAYEVGIKLNNTETFEELRTIMKRY